MANIIDLVTVGEKGVIVVDAIPSSSGGTSASIGTIAIYDSGTAGSMYIKTSNLDTGWDLVGTTSGSGVVASGVAGRLALYAATGNTVDDVYVQNSQNIDVEIAAQPSRSAALVYTIPNPGNAVTAASFVLTEGAQTINGNKTFSNDVTISGDLTVNGTLTSVNTTNTTITDALITLNKGGGAASATNTGFEIEENSVITGYFKTDALRDSFSMKAPATFELEMDLALLTADRKIQFQDLAGTVALQASTSALTSGSILFSNASGLISQANSSLFWDATNSRVGIGTNAPSAQLHTTGTVRFASLSSGIVHSDANGNLSSSAVSLTADVSGVLPIANGGTNNSAAYTAGSVIFSDGSKLTEANSDFFWDNTNKRLGIGVTTPFGKLTVAESSTAANRGIHVVNSENTTAAATANVILKRSRGTLGTPTAVQSGDSVGAFGFNSYGDTGYASSITSGMLAVATELQSDTAHGTKLLFKVTPNTTATSKNAMEIGQDGALGLYGSTSGLLKIIPAATVTSHTLTMPAAQGAANTSLVNDGSGNLSWSKISLTAGVSGVLPIANGGTNSSTALNDNRIMVSSGGAIVEASSLDDGELLIGSTGSAPVAASITGTSNQVSVTNGPGSITLALPQNIHTGATPTFAGETLSGAGAFFNLIDAADLKITTATVNTTDATVTDIATIATVTDSVMVIEAKITGLRTGGTAGATGDSACYIRTARIKNVGGTVTLSNLQADYTSEDQATFNGTITVSGTNVLVQVKGAANNNMTWKVVITKII